ncbi:MAG: hypothetical protein WAX04_12980 [Oscillospiraceae bacterium]
MANIIIFIEGPDDKTFFQNIIQPLINDHYHCIFYFEYANKNKTRVKNFINSAKNNNTDYIYVSDIDNGNSIGEKKKKIVKKLSILVEDKIVVVVREIESWYLSGLDEKSSKRLKVKNLKDTNNMVKEQFDYLIPNKYTRVEFMLEIIKHFSLDTAKVKNSSFNYLCEQLSL